MTALCSFGLGCVILCCTLFLFGIGLIRAFSDVKKPFIYFDWWLICQSPQNNFEQPEKSRVRLRYDLCFAVLCSCIGCFLLCCALLPWSWLCFARLWSSMLGCARFYCTLLLWAWLCHSLLYFSHLVLAKIYALLCSVFLGLAFICFALLCSPGLCSVFFTTWPGCALFYFSVLYLVSLCCSVLIWIGLGYVYMPYMLCIALLFLDLLGCALPLLFLSWLCSV